MLRVATPTKDHVDWIAGRVLGKPTGDGHVFVPCLCAHLSLDNRCLVENVKPLFCKMHPVGEVECRTLWKALGLLEVCGCTDESASVSSGCDSATPPP